MVEVEGQMIPFRFDPKRDVVVIEGEVLRRLPALNLPQLLSLVANLNFVTRGLFQADPEMTGFNQEQVAVLVNGAPFNNAQTGHHNFCLPFEADQIRRIEVLRGGGPSGYGSAGAGGAVNIVTAGANRVRAGASSFRTFGTSLDIGNENLSFSAGVTATGGYMDGLDGKKIYAQGRRGWPRPAAFSTSGAAGLLRNSGPSTFTGLIHPTKRSAGSSELRTGCAPFSRSANWRSG